MAAASSASDGPKKAQTWYKGFVAGVFSGVTKLVVGHPFDTVKVRLQTTDRSRFSGPLQCLGQTLSKEGVRGLYKGATPPLFGWMFMDSIMLGSLTIYRRLLAQHAFAPAGFGHAIHGSNTLSMTSEKWTQAQVQAVLPSWGHGIAGAGAGCTVSFVAAPVEHIKARLQVQYAADKSARLYSGPIECIRRIYRHHGIRGIYHGLTATLIFRGSFFFMWTTYDIMSREMRQRTRLSEPAINFWAGGLSAQLFWLIAYPADVVKQRVMTDPLGGGLNDGQRRFPRWRDAAVAVYRQAGWKGYFRGFVPSFIRACPTNAAALVTFEGIMRALA